MQLGLISSGYFTAVDASASKDGDIRADGRGGKEARFCGDAGFFSERSTNWQGTRPLCRKI